MAGEVDRYRYVLDAGKDRSFCAQMQKIYNNHFAFPWKRPSLSVLKDDPAYGPKGSYAFPKLPGVNHDARMTLDMSYSRLPSSSEFDAVAWKEGRYRLMSDQEQPMLIAELDINNDGQNDIVVKPHFMLTLEPAHGSVPGGEDALLVFSKGDIELGRPLVLGLLYQTESGKRPALIAGGHTRRVTRPFILGGRAYLSTYEQVWEGGEFRDLGNRFSRLEAEYINVLSYRGGSHNLGTAWSPLDVDTLCRFRMVVVKNP
jgi:hypothetical protein